MADGDRDYGNFVYNHPALVAVLMSLVIGGVFLRAVFAAAEGHEGGHEHATAEHAAPGGSGAAHAPGSGSAKPAGEHAPAH
ncbi:MAG TPA: hypothetical protein VL400_18440 [Polyangiaceae bacterium]|nr:hypothetical protein [Polyangiaceae bacterium]